MPAPLHPSPAILESWLPALRQMPLLPSWRLASLGRSVMTVDPLVLMTDVEQATEALLRTADGLDDRAVAGPSLLPGWTRGHVLTHVARNADAMTNLLTWARTGVETPAYASPEARGRGHRGGRRPAAGRADRRHPRRARAVRRRGRRDDRPRPGRSICRPPAQSAAARALGAAARGRGAPRRPRRRATRRRTGRTRSRCGCCARSSPVPSRTRRPWCCARSASNTR